MSSAEFWQLSMYYTYGSLVGVCNLIFTVALFALTYVKWGSSGLLFRCALILGCSLFTVIQPLLIYRRACAQAAALKAETELVFDDKGLHVTVGGVCNHISWNQIKRISKKPTMLVIFSDTTHGYVLTNRVLGRDREPLYAYITARMHNR